MSTWKLEIWPLLDVGGATYCKMRELLKQSFNTNWIGCLPQYFDMWRHTSSSGELQIDEAQWWSEKESAKVDSYTLLHQYIIGVTIQCNAMQYNTIQYNYTIQYNTIQYNKPQLFIYFDKLKIQWNQYCYWIHLCSVSRAMLFTEA